MDNNQSIKEVDGRGLACPAPVLLTKEAVEKSRPAVLSVLVDNEAAKQNVSRFLESQNYNTTVDKKGEDFLVSGYKGDEMACEVPSVEEAEEGDQKIMVMVSTDRFGSGDDELGKKLVISFVKTLKEMGPELWRLVFVNNGVKLTVNGSQVLEDLKGYEEAGIKILVCGTCLTHFDILDQKEVGETTNMLDIVTAMQNAGKVINI